MKDHIKTYNLIFFRKNKNWRTKLMMIYNFAIRFILGACREMDRCVGRLN